METFMSRLHNDKKISKNIKNKKNLDYILNNMRMTVCEMG